MQSYLPLAARIFLSIVFLRAAVAKLLDPAGTQQVMASKGLPLAGFLLIGAIVLLLGGGLSILLGYKTRWGVIALLVFLIPTTLIFHTNWAENTQVIQFTKNLAISGGLLMLAAFGSGALSLDEKLANRYSNRIF
jgi:putative oxidoreductase